MGIESSSAVVRWPDLRAAGFDTRAVRRALRAGSLQRLARGLYATASQRPYQDLREVAARLDGVISGTTAARLHGIELARSETSVHVSIERGRRVRCLLPGVEVHRATLAPGDVEQLGGLPVTTVTRTLLDLAAWLPCAQAVAAADSAVRLGRVGPAELSAAAGTGQGRVARRIALVDPECGSVLESMFRILVLLARLPAPQTQVDIRDGRGGWIGRVDFAWVEARVIVETDGLAWHSSAQQWRADRRRDVALQRAGWLVVRLSWEDVVNTPAQVLSLMRALLAERA